MNRFTTEESLLYLKDKLGIDLEEDEFEYLKEHSKKDLKRNIEYLRRHENAYIQEYFDRIEEMRLIGKRLWKLVEDNPHNPILQKDCLSELCKSTIAMTDFYQSIRELDQENTTLKAESKAISASGPETKSAPKVESSEASTEEPEAISTSRPETISTPTPEVEPSELKEESEAIIASSPETNLAPPPPEVEIPQQFSPKKIARYTSAGKLITADS
jgi:hypothetical protein